ncbi:hypothetical protein MTR67_048900 [Solanum verrucosum]|uniref:Exocyst complex component SEC3A n=1 Tax=Solanum verrucosum TaxID=315347 RepID=A0AAF0V0E9_SOLVR|nr:hypothetical protein MTR67_048900 [Solanum verrucosum]
MSPFLFLLAMRGLNHMLKIAKTNGWIKDFSAQSGRENQLEITHLVYADDALIFCEAERTRGSWTEEPLQTEQLSPTKVVMEILHRRWGLMEKKNDTISQVWSQQGCNLLFRRAINGWEIRQVASLLGTLNTCPGIFMSPEKPIWKLHSKGHFIVKSCYWNIDSNQRATDTGPWKEILEARSPPKVTCFSWLVCRKARLTHEALQKRGWQLGDAQDNPGVDESMIETRNNKLEMQSVNNKALIEELDRLLERLRIPSEYAACLTSGSFEEARMPQNIEACEWLTNALHGLESPKLDPSYSNMRAVKEKRAEVDKLKTTFVRRASEFLRNYFSSLVDFMMSDKSYFSQRGQLKRPDHADLRYKCRTYARLLQHLKSLDKNCLGPLRKAYCTSLNLLLRREAREFANELRSSTKASKNPIVWFEGLTGLNQSVNNADTSAASEAYAKMLTIFIPLLVDESSFFAHFMCFEVPTLLPPEGVANGNKAGDDMNDDLGIMDIDENDNKSGQNSADLEALNESLHDLLDGIQEDFFAVVDWAGKIDPMCCISMHGITERYIPDQKADTAGFVRILLDDLESRISMQFSRFVEETCHQIERNERNVRQLGVLSFIPRFATLATRMEQYIQGQSRDLVDQAYTKFVTIMFVTLDKIAQTDLKYQDIMLLENYASFQNSLYDLANVVPTLAKFYHQASESYEQACTRHINTIIYYQFERLFQFARRIEDLMYTITPEEIPFQIGLSKADLRKVVKYSLSGVDKSISTMYKRLQKNLASEELLPSLWDKCKKEFLEKYESFVQLINKVYPTDSIPSISEMRGLLASM